MSERERERERVAKHSNQKERERERTIDRVRQTANNKETGKQQTGPTKSYAKPTGGSFYRKNCVGQTCFPKYSFRKLAKKKIGPNLLHLTCKMSRTIQKVGSTIFQHWINTEHSVGVKSQKWKTFLSLFFPTANPTPINLFIAG